MEPSEEGGAASLVDDLVDCRLNGDFSHVQAKMILEIAASCLEEDRSKRPSMSCVVQALISVEDQGHAF
ncbi:hypothetical protein GUJ93_ZPchr0011g28236 [Zizania palustris]|uniref:Uncharacterized protein n=1 Tax=Zizania palustris TaxID=103762 RepID=A0A8J6BSC5_ZIZPA|nr:hypothetical protein GUJ93_ZPchr0011g28236 [Zizania palustris]